MEQSQDAALYKVLPYRYGYKMYDCPGQFHEQTALQFIALFLAIAQVFHTDE